MTETKVTGRVSSHERMPSSKNGNPRYRLVLDDGRTLTTSPDSMVAYAITNSEFVGRWQDREAGTPLPLVTFTLNSRGQIIHAKSDREA